MYDDGQVWRVKLTARRAWGLCWDGGRHRAEARQHATAAADNTQHRQFTTAINTALWWRHCAVSRSSSSAVSISLNLDCLAAVTNIRFGLHCFDSVGRRQEGYPILSKGPFIAMQLNSTWRRAELSAGRYRHFADANSTSSWVAIDTLTDATQLSPTIGNATESTGSRRSELIGDSCSRCEHVDNSTSSWVVSL